MNKFYVTIFTCTKIITYEPIVCIFVAKEFENVRKINPVVKLESDFFITKVICDLTTLVTQYRFQYFYISQLFNSDRMVQKRYCVTQ